METVTSRLHGGFGKRLEMISYEKGGGVLVETQKELVRIAKSDWRTATAANAKGHVERVMCAGNNKNKQLCLPQNAICRAIHK